MLQAINEQLDAAKFVPDLKAIVADLARDVDARLARLETVALEHAELIDREAFHFDSDERIDAKIAELRSLIAPAEAATDAPSDGETTEVTETTETTLEA